MKYIGCRKNGLIISSSREYKRGKYPCTVDLLFDWFGISRTTTDNFCFYLQNRLIQTSQKGGQRYMILPPFVFPAASYEADVPENIELMHIYVKYFIRSYKTTYHN
jgi:hypothetical protein